MPLKQGASQGKGGRKLARKQLLSAVRDSKQVVYSRSLKKQLDFDVIHHESRLSVGLYVLMGVVF